MSTFGPDFETVVKQFKDDLNAVQRADRAQKKKDNKGKLVVQRVARGKQADVGGEAYHTIAIIMEDARKRFEGAVMRRTVDSRDYEGKPISGLEPYEQRMVLLKLSHEEQETIDELAAEMSQDAGRALSLTHGRVSFIYCFLFQMMRGCVRRGCT